MDIEVAGTKRIASRIEIKSASEPGLGLDTELKLKQETDLLAIAKTLDCKEYKYEINQFETEVDRDDSISIRAADPTPVFYYHPDHLGTSTVISNSTGALHQYFFNLPFGEPNPLRRSRMSSPTPINSIIRGQTMIEGCTNTSYELNYKFNAKELDAESGMYYYGARYYDPRISVWMSVDPMAHERVEWTPYNAMRCTPIMNIDPDGALDTDFLNKETGQTQHVEDGMDQVIMVNNKDYQKISELNSPTKTQWNKAESEFYMNTITKGEKLDWNSDLGKVSRVVHGEMSGIGATSNADRQVAAESIVNRKESGLYGQTYSDILTPDQYNAMRTSTYKNGPYAYMNGLKEKQPYFYKAHENEIRGNFLNALSVSFKAMNGLGTEIGNGVVSFVSPPLKSTHFDTDPYLKNITTTIPGLKGVSGAWKRK